MKKISILSVCALMGMTAFGQASVVKEAENAMKKGEYFEEVVKIITPALTNPETAEQAITYYIPGKAGFNTFDEMLKLAMVGQLPENGEKLRSEALLGGYDYFQKVLPLDQLPNEKGKIKPKYTKDVYSIIGGHHGDFSNAAIDFWNNNDFENAFRAWEIYCAMPYDDNYKKYISVIPADTLIAEIMYNRSLAAYQTGDMPRTVKSFLEAKEHGYTKKPLYDYAISAAYQAGDNATVTALCEEALPLYGAEDTRYIRQLINGYIEAKDYKGALDMINNAIVGEPQNAQYYVIRGILYEQEGLDGDSQAEFAKAVELDPNSSEALFNLGRTIYNLAVKYNDEAPTDPQEYAKVKNEKIIPTLQQAIEYLEKAWTVDNENSDSLKLLEQAYYLTEDDANLKYTQDRLSY